MTLPPRRNSGSLLCKVYEPEIRAHLGTAAHFCEAVGLQLRMGDLQTAEFPSRGGNFRDDVAAQQDLGELGAARERLRELRQCVVLPGKLSLRRS